MKMRSRDPTVLPTITPALFGAVKQTGIFFFENSLLNKIQIFLLCFYFHFLFGVWRKMPPLSSDDFYKLLQKSTVMERKTCYLDVNMDVNVFCGKETTLPMIQNDKHEQAN